MMREPRPHQVFAGDVVLWRTICLRGTGFPARLLLGLAASTTAAAIDAALADERRGGRAFAEAGAALEAMFTQDRLRVSDLLREIAATPRFREAVIWQNRRAVATGLDALLRRPAGAMNSKARQYEELVARYLQRYCAKNDTIGFFGPVGWATIDESLASARVAPGPGLVERRTVYFEHWAIDALATKLSEDRVLRASLPPRRLPTIRIEGDVLYHPVDRMTQLPAAHARVLHACDGERSAQLIAEELIADGDLELGSVDEIYDLLDELIEARAIVWRLEVPTAGFHPEDALRAGLAWVDAGPAREVAEAALAELEAARARVAAAAGDPVLLDVALAALEETFVVVTGMDASRSEGKTYAGRGIVYEDCRRDVDVVLGQTFLERIAPPLALVEASARWFSHTIASRFREVFEQLYRDLTAEVGAPDVDYIRYYIALRPHLSNANGAISPTVLEVRDELQRRWADVLAWPSGTRRVDVRASDLAPRVAAAFAAPGPGWPSARHNSPDVLIAAASPEALARGEFFLVLGEVHSGVNSVTLPMLAKEHRDPAHLHEARRADVGPGVAQVEPRGSAHRAMHYTLAEHDVDIEYGDTRSWRPRDQVLDVAGFVVTKLDGRLVVRRRDASRAYDLVAFLEGNLTVESFNFEMFRPSPHRPRITIDGLVVARERWRFEAADLAFARLSTPFARFVGARRWATEHGLPRFSFVKAVEEPKPVYLDLESPTYVEIFCKLARAGCAIGITEMLPTFEQLWLVDAAGERYCSELRMTLVDDVAWTSP